MAPRKSLSIRVLTFAAIIFAAVAASAAPAKPPVLPAQKLLKSYGARPLSFEPNQGQSAPQVQFLSRGRAYELFLTPSEAVLAVRQGKSSAPDQAAKADAAPPDSKSLAQQEHDAQYQVLHIRLAGANPNPLVTAADKLRGLDNYYIGHDPKRWLTGIPTYGAIEYRKIYPGVDLIYHSSQEDRLEYDFVVAPGTNPDSIKFAFGGVSGLTINKQGDLVVAMAGESIVEHAPIIRQGGHTVAGGYVLAHNGLVGFKIGAYDKAKPLIIDPVLEYSTYLGGSAEDAGNAIAVDALGDAYVTGTTASANFPTQSPTQGSNHGGEDAFISKVAPDGKSLIYSTFLGGSDTDEGLGIAVDSSNNAYVTGATASSDFPTLGSFPGNALHGAGTFDAFVAKLDSTGALSYSFYLGGSGSDFGNAIAVDPTSGTAFVTGNTTSTDIVSTGFQASNAGGVGGDAFVASVKSDGSALNYFTFLGGSDTDEGTAIAIDSGDNAYVAGYTFSADFPGVTAANVGPSLNGLVDAFVTKIASNGLSQTYSTYLGGSLQDFATGIAVDSIGNAYVTGFTGSTDFPTTPGVLQPSLVVAPDAYVTKLNPDATSLVYSTYLGGENFDQANGIAIDPFGQAWVTGETTSTLFFGVSPSTGTLGSFSGPESDVFAAQISGDGSALLSFAYLGGAGTDVGNGVAVDAAGSAYVTGSTTSNNFPIVPNPGAAQTVFGGGTVTGDAFVSKLMVASPTPTPSPSATATPTPTPTPTATPPPMCTPETVSDSGSFACGPAQNATFQISFKQNANCSLTGLKGKPFTYINPCNGDNIICSVVNNLSVANNAINFVCTGKNNGLPANPHVNLKLKPPVININGPGVKPAAGPVRGGLVVIVLLPPVRVGRIIGTGCLDDPDDLIVDPSANPPPPMASFDVDIVVVNNNGTGLGAFHYRWDDGKTVAPPNNNRLNFAQCLNTRSPGVCALTPNAPINSFFSVPAADFKPGASASFSVAFMQAPGCRDIERNPGMASYSVNRCPFSVKVTTAPGGAGNGTLSLDPTKITTPAAGRRFFGVSDNTPVLAQGQVGNATGMNRTCKSGGPLGTIFVIGP